MRSRQWATQVRQRRPPVSCPVCHQTAQACQCQEQLWTVSDVASYLRMHPKTIYDFVARGQLPCAHLGNRLRFRPLDIARWVAARLE